MCPNENILSRIVTYGTKFMQTAQGRDQWHNGQFTEKKPTSSPSRHRLDNSRPRQLAGWMIGRVVNLPTTNFKNSHLE